MKAYQTITLKQIIILLVMIIVSYGCGRAQEEIDKSQLQERTGVWYKIDTEIPYTGRVFAKYPNGQKMECTYKDGKFEGTYTLWYRTGRKRSERTWKDGKEEGTATSWHRNGQKQSERTFKDGVPEGPVTTWYENGQKEQEMTYKDGKMINEKRWDKDGNIEK